MKHPIQNVALVDGRLRFTKNIIVRHLVEQLEKFGYTLDNLHMYFCERDFDDDWDQFNQLIGYSVSGAPFKDEHVRESAYKMHENGMDEITARAHNAEAKLTNVRELLLEGVSDLYNIHPDDLVGD